MLKLSREDPLQRAAGLDTATAKSANPVVAKPKRPTTVLLAQQLQQITAVIPGLAAQVEELAKAQAALQQQQLLQPSPPPVAGPSSTVAQLAAPLGLGASPKFLPAAGLGGLIGPPPGRRPTAAPPHTLMTFPEQECEEAAENLANPQSSESPLAQAVLAQSQALTALVAQLSTGDTADLSLPGASVGARGKAAGGARQQQRRLLPRCPPKHGPPHVPCQQPLFRSGRALEPRSLSYEVLGEIRRIPPRKGPRYSGFPGCKCLGRDAGWKDCPGGRPPGPPGRLFGTGCSTRWSARPRVSADLSGRTAGRPLLGQSSSNADSGKSVRAAGCSTMGGRCPLLT